MVGTPVTRAEIVCPEFGLIMDHPDGEDDPGISLHIKTRPGDDLTIALGDDLTWVKFARDRTAAVMSAWGLGGHIPAATLVVSELVTNALRHALPSVEVRPHPPVLLRLVRRRRSVVCLVADPSDRPPVLAEADFAAETGRGLYLVAAHSRRWDWAPRRDRPGKWVWALLPPPADASR
ncbi:ATP-binding protein [Actinoallomurus sp. NBC_01490]|uniref:ATP-binding protein n=1 Tax=Actinoallomurus sp. NBC_01490 TaxID=2903557 RepID=UPI002E320E86|nr:ATP-binding protein [Actinoallomurus sp. NBC_01490]